MSFHTITIYSATSCYLYTHIHYQNQQFLWENWEGQWKARYHFFERVQGNFLNCGLWIGSSMVLITLRHSHSNNWHVMCILRHWMSISNILRGFWASPRSPIQLMPQPSPPLFKLHYKLPLHIMGLCPIIQIWYLFQWTFFFNDSSLLPQTFLPQSMHQLLLI